MPTKGDGDYAVRLRDDAHGWRRARTEIRVTPDDPVLDGLTEQEAEDLVNRQWALVPHNPDESTPDPPFDPSTVTVDDLEGRLDEGDFSADELDALSAAESAGKDRDTAHDAIDAAREE